MQLQHPNYVPGIVEIQNSLEKIERSIRQLSGVLDRVAVVSERLADVADQFGTREHIGPIDMDELNEELERP